MTIIIELALLAVGFFLLVKGADWFVDGASGIADKFGIPQLVIGLTIVAMGTSAPEAAVSIAAALKGTADITVGNVLGSNILNVFIILGCASVITVIAVAETTVKYEIPFMLAMTGFFAFLGYTDGMITFAEGVVLWACFIAYLAYMFVMCKKGVMQAEEIISSGSVPKLLFFMIVGMGLIIFGSDVTVDAATELAKIFGMSERFIGLTVVALGTSLPELVTSVVAARRDKADIAIGNIVGSNIFNILFVVGTSALIIPIAFAEKFLIDCGIAFAAGLMLWLFVFKKRNLNRRDGALMLLAYGVYFGYLMLQ